MIPRLAFVASISALFAGVAACASDSGDGGGKGSAGSGGSNPAGGASSGGTSSGSGGNNSGGSSSGASGNSSGGSSSGASSGGSGAGGASGSTGSGGDAGTNGSGGSGGANTCPPSLPLMMPVCSVPSQMCSYGQTICTCVVSVGVPGGMHWVCDFGGTGGGSGAGGSGGSSSGPCGECAEGEQCIFQAGGPGPSRFRCANNPPCTVPLPGPCACIMGQGSCNYQMATTDAGVVEICVCDNGLE